MDYFRGTIIKIQKPVSNYTQEQAIKDMNEWVQHPKEFGKPFQSVEVIFEQEILRPDGGRSPIYLVNFKIDGKSYIGCTGENLHTWCFRDINFDNFEHDELIEMYVGWMLCIKEKQALESSSASPKTPTEKEKEKFLKRFEKKMDLGEDIELLKSTSLGGKLYHCVLSGGWGVVADQKVKYVELYDPPQYNENPWLMIYHYFGWQWNPLDKEDE